MKVSEDLQDYGLEDEDPAAALGTKLEEVGLKCNGCDLESAERRAERLSANSDKPPSRDSTWDLKMCGVEEHSAEALVDLYGGSDQAPWKEAM